MRQRRAGTPLRVENRLYVKLDPYSPDSAQSPNHPAPANPATVLSCYAGRQRRGVAGRERWTHVSNCLAQQRKQNENRQFL